MCSSGITSPGFLNLSSVHKGMTVSTSFPLFNTKEFAYLYCSDNPVSPIWSSKESNLYLLHTAYLFLSSQEEFGNEDPFWSWQINCRCCKPAQRPPEHWKFRKGWGERKTNSQVSNNRITLLGSYSAKQPSHDFLHLTFFSPVTPQFG